MFRQGDILIVPTDQPIGQNFKPQKRDAQGRVVLAYGEATGHAHALLDEGVVLHRDDAGNVMLSVGGGGASVVHEEHATIPLKPGNYQVIRQREYSPETIRQVAD